MSKVTVSLLCMALLAACAEAPQSTGPAVISGALQGSIAAGTFHDRRDWFSVGIPFRRATDGYRYTQLQESYPPNISFVAFMSPISPGEYYRAYTEDFFASNHKVPNLDQVADSVLQVYGRQLVAARTAPMELQQEKPWQLGGTRGLLRLYTQKVPTELLSLDIMRGPGLAEDYIAYILMYVTVKNGKVAMLWAEWPQDCAVCVPIPTGAVPTAGADAIDRALATDARAGAFLDSFSYAAGAAAYQ
ncbi:MAG: hypothetical protein ACHQAZ_00895 [Gammaproteobacteria bacterium]